MIKEQFRYWRANVVLLEQAAVLAAGVVKVYVYLPAYVRACLSADVCCRLKFLV